mmetsp:Transcript_34775/g.88072  ORF Transcript_34775/g.88072 Transcript_34775/m.88072 type:complete len:333 (-) Transcript_34775:313-1311(-)
MASAGADVQAAVAKGGAEGTAADQANRSKKQEGKKKKKGNATQEELALNQGQADFVRVVRVEPKKEAHADDPYRVALSKNGKATQLVLSEDKLTVSGTKGFRTARATHGVFQGAWYCEARVVHLGESGHVRLGWCTRKAELQAPVGFDVHGYCYRDLEGSKVHAGKREPYGQQYGEGDVVGLYIYMPDGGRPLEVRDRRVVRYKGALYYLDEHEPDAQPLQGAVIAFTRNGELQGPAFTDFPDGTYYPAASLYTLPTQTQGACVTFNFGPDFAYPMPEVPGCPAPRPMCEAAETKAPTPPPEQPPAAAPEAAAPAEAAPAAAGTDAPAEPAN